MRRDKKLDERNVMRLFIDKLQDFPKGKLIQQESPDFILKVNRRKHINIELTQILFKESKSSELLSHLTSEVKNSISKKDQKLRLYNSNKPFQNWLIIYCDSFYSSNDVALDKYFEKIQFEIDFDKLYLFGLFEGLIIKLQKSK